MMSQGLGRRSSRHSLSTRELCAAFLADTTSLLALQAGPPEGTTMLGSDPVQHGEACQQCQDSILCLQCVCTASVLGAGKVDLPKNDGLQGTGEACCAEAGAKPPCHVTSSSNEAWHAANM